MLSHRRIRIAVVSLVACAALAPAAAAEPGNDYPQPSPAKIGDTPADFAQPGAPAPRIGDTPIDHPGASRAPEYDPVTTIEVVRPERTVVRDTDPALPLVLSGAALLVALTTGASVAAGSVRRARVRVSH